MPFENTIKRMFVIVKTMYEDAITALEAHNTVLSEDVVNRDMDVDRLNWLIARQTNMILQECISVPEDGDLNKHGNALLHAQPNHRAYR
jgi:phosphate uptake regulator